MKNILSSFYVAMIAVLFSSVCSAQAILFQDQMTDPNAWGVNKGVQTDSSATFGYDYSADGIPEAPHSQLGDTATSGVKLEANFDGSASATFLTIYPLGQNFTGDYVLEFDMWMNYSVEDREDGGGDGTTEFAGGGIGYDGVTADVASGAQSIVTGESGSGSDYRSFKDGFFIPGVNMACGSRNATGCTEYTDLFPLGSGVPPVSQSQDTAHQGGGDPNNPDPDHQHNVAGTPGFQWATWRISVAGDTVRTEIENQLGNSIDIVVYDKTNTGDGSSGVSTDGNISIFYADFFTSISPSPDLTFGIVDNVVVTEGSIPGDFDFDGDVDGNDFLVWQRGGSPNPLSAGDLTLWETNYGVGPLISNVTSVPEPTSCALLILGASTLVLMRRKQC